MEHIKSFTPDTEKAEREHTFTRLEETAGFANLSPKQQQMIRVSLYGTQRAFRGSDSVSAENIGEGDFGTQIQFAPGVSSYKAAETQSYGVSQKAIYDWYCHAAVQSLEVKNTNFYNNIHSDRPEMENGHKITSKDDVSAFIDLEMSDKNLPLVLHVLTKDYFLHSAIVLGPDQSGEWLVWEKRGTSREFRLATLDDVFSDYKGRDPNWVVRPIKSNTN